MQVQKKCSLILFVVLGLGSGLKAEEVENYDSGKKRVAQIVSNDETGIPAYNKSNVHYAQTQNTAKDLEIKEIAKFFECKTLIGQSFIEETLKFPVSPEDKNSVLANRQNTIKALVENPELKKQVDKLLCSAQSHEQEVVKLMSEFFIGKTCPDLTNLELIKKQNPWFLPMYEFFFLNSTGRSIATTMSIFGLGSSVYITQLLGRAAYDVAQNGGDYNQLALYTAYTGFATALYTYTNYKDYTAASEKRQKLHSLNQLIDIAEKFETLCTQNSLHPQFKISAISNEQGKALVNALKSARYKNKTTWLFLTPLVHTFLYNLYQQDKHLAQVFASIAELDAYNAIAGKIIESQPNNNKLCFVKFIDNPQPTINARSFWNVLVKNSVTNNLSETKHVILTGPNAGGKSTTIRALLQNIILGQSFGVAAAEEFEFTMFDIIGSYLNISDDQINGLSLFASEVKRAKEVLETIKSLQPHQKFFFALDELFTGTVAEDGQKCAYDFIKKITSFDRVQSIYATHFEKLKELGNSANRCVNYKVDAPIKNAQGKLVYPFTLNKGASNSHVALDLAKEAGLFD